MSDKKYSLDDLKAMYEKTNREIKEQEIYKSYFSVKMLVNDKLKPVVTQAEARIKDLTAFNKYLEAEIEKYVEKK